MMNIDIAGRHVEITKALRTYIEDRLHKLESLLDGPSKAHVVLASAKHRHLAEIQVKSRTALLSSAKETEDLKASINEVVERLEGQARRHKEKLRGRKKREGRKIAAVEVEAEVPAPKRRARLQPAAGARTPLLRSERYRLKPLSAEDAAMELEGSGGELLVYRDARTYRVNVVYRRRDGNFGHVDPEF
jgi:putative sigma-54 modulation protein